MRVTQWFVLTLFLSFLSTNLPTNYVFSASTLSCALQVITFTIDSAGMAAAVYSASTPFLCFITKVVRLGL